MTEAIYDAGFNSSGRFYEKSTNMLGMTPTKYRDGGANEEIRFAVGESLLGAILVASSKKGVSSILLGDDPEALVRDLQDRFPNARLIGGDKVYEAMVARVVGFVEAAWPRARSAARCPRHRSPTARVAGLQGNSGGPDRFLCRDRAPHRVAQIRSRRGRGLEQPCRRDFMSSRGPERRIAFITPGVLSANAPSLARRRATAINWAARYDHLARFAR